MDKATDNTPPGWADILDESLAEVDSGLLASREDVRRLFREAEARRKPEAKAPLRRAPIDH